MIIYIQAAGWAGECVYFPSRRRKTYTSIQSGFSTAFMVCVRAASRKENTILEDTRAVIRDGTKKSPANRDKQQFVS